MPDLALPWIEGLIAVNVQMTHTPYQYPHMHIGEDVAMRLISLHFLAAAALAASAGVAAAEGLSDGEALYVSNCAACHGVSGKGDGDMANVMNIPAPNLTLLSQANDGEFPMLRVIQIIDGRSGVRAHGGPMPIFGAVFSADASASGLNLGTEIEARGRVLSLAQYLESIQQK